MLLHRREEELVILLVVDRRHTKSEGTKQSLYRSVKADDRCVYIALEHALGGTGDGRALRTCA